MKARVDILCGKNQSKCGYIEVGYLFTLLSKMPGFFAAAGSLVFVVAIAPD